MRYPAVNSDPENPSLVASSYISLSQEGFTMCEVVSKAALSPQVTNDTRIPPLPPVHSPLSLHHKVHTQGLMQCLPVQRLMLLKGKIHKA